MHSNYNIVLSLDPSRQFLSAQVQLSWLIDGATDRLEFLLHRDMQVTYIGGEEVAGYHREPRAYAFSPEAVTWVLDLKGEAAEGALVSLEFNYSGTFSGPIPQAWQVNRITSDWVELGMYGPWFPWNPIADPFAYTVQIDIPGYTLVGLGDTIRKGKHWLVTSVNPQEDIVIIAAPSMDCFARNAGASSLDVWYTEPEDAGCAEVIGEDGVWAIDFYHHWLGDAVGTNDMTIVVAKRDTGGGYARPGLVIIQAMDEDSRQRASFIDYLAHELAHFWWHEAPTSSWEDWLNEAFAEYSALKAIAVRRGRDVFTRVINQKRESMKGLPPIRGLERRHEKAYEVLYDKGTVLLHDLEEQIGQEKFTILLKERLARRINTTSGFLALLSELVDGETADSFSRCLDV